jgi:hypothetical protein
MKKKLKIHYVSSGWYKSKNQGCFSYSRNEKIYNLNKTQELQRFSGRIIFAKKWNGSIGLGQDMTAGILKFKIYSWICYGPLKFLTLIGPG